MRKHYCCDANRHLFQQYYSGQQKGGGEFPVYIGRANRQSGHGFGDVLKGLLRRLKPLVQTLAPRMLQASANLLENWKDEPRREEQTGSGFRKRK
jgi:hypothetical protein